MLAFEYCECGCKGSESEVIGHTAFWLFDTLKGPVFLAPPSPDRGACGVEGDAKMKMTNGTRVEIHTSATALGTGSGKRGTVVAVRSVKTAVTGALLLYEEVDVRLDSGALVTRESRELRVVVV